MTKRSFVHILSIRMFPDLAADQQERVVTGVLNFLYLAIGS